MFRILRKENTPRTRVGYMYGAWDVHGTPLQERVDMDIMQTARVGNRERTNHRGPGDSSGVFIPAARRVPSLPGGFSFSGAVRR